jgi:hypothetical protein
VTSHLFIFGNSRFKSLFAQAAFLVLSAAAAWTRIIATYFGAYSGILGLRRRDLLFKGLPTP